MRLGQESRENERRRAVSRAMKRSVVTRQCPKCRRKAALCRKTYEDGFTIVYCRYEKRCGYSRGGYITEAS